MAQDMKPQNLVMLAALGIGVYFFMVRKTSAKSLGARYGVGPMTGPYNESYLPTKKPQPTNSNYVDLASSAFDLYNAWTKKDAAPQAYVPDFTAANVGPTVAYNPQAAFSDLNDWREP